MISHGDTNAFARREEVEILSKMYSLPADGDTEELRGNRRIPDLPFEDDYRLITPLQRRWPES